MKIQIALCAVAFTLMGCGDTTDGGSCVGGDELSIVVDMGLDTKGTMVDSEASMGSIGLYCAHTADQPWSTTTTFGKLLNQRLDYDSTTISWRYDGTTPTWDMTSLTDRYTFYAYSPYDSTTQGIEPRIESGALWVDYTVPTECASQSDLMLSIPRKNIYPQVGGSVELSFKHTLASIGFGVKGVETDIIDKIVLRGVVPGGSVTISDSGEVVWDYLYDRTTLEYEATIESGVVPNISTSESLTTDNGYLMMIPQSIGEIEIEVTKLDGDVVIFNFEDGEEWEAGRQYQYTFNFSSYDYTIEGTASCYMLHPNGEEQIFYIPVEGRINTFWRYYADDKETYKDRLSSSDVWSANILWYDVDSGVSFNGFKAERVTSGFTPNSGVVTAQSAPDFTTPNARSAMKITLPSSITEGNVLIAVEFEGEILWSWHLWITEYNPDNIVSQSTAQEGVCVYRARREEGEVHRYDDSGLWSGIYADKFIMDRNLGSRGSGYFNQTGVIHYQFGRKDPFPISCSTSIDIVKDQVSFVEAVHNPLVFYTQTERPFSWCDEGVESNDQYLWNDQNLLNAPDSSGKSIFDPSPLGWRVPRFGTYAVFTDNNCAYNDNSSEILVYDGMVNLPMTGFRSNQNGTIKESSTQGNLRTSTPIDSSFAYNLSYDDGINTDTNNTRSDGFCIRCVEE